MRRLLRQKVVLALGGALIIVLLFQNCSQSRFMSTDESQAGVKAENGTGYEGKPDYYRFVPGFTCENIESPKSHLRQQGPEYLLTENKEMLCAASYQQIPVAALDTSVFQNIVVGYREGILEYKDSTPTAIPANLVEVWCRDRKDHLGIETISHFDRVKSEAVTRIYHGHPNPTGGFDTHMIPDFGVVRTVSQTQVILRDSNGFELIVHRDRPAVELGLFQGELKASIDGADYSSEVNCRVGGAIDTSVWPARQIVDTNINSMDLSPDKTFFAYSAVFTQGKRALFKILADGRGNARIGPWPIGPGVDELVFSPDSSWIYYRDTYNPAEATALYRIRPDGSGFADISEELINKGNGVDDLSISSDGRFLLYRDGAHNFYNATGDKLVKVIAVTTEGDFSPPITISPRNPDPPVGDTGRTWYFASKVSGNGQRIALLGGGQIYSNLYLVNPDGSGLIKATPRFPSSDWHIQWFAPLLMPDDGDYVLVPVVYNNFGGDWTMQLYAVSLDGLEAFTVGDPVPQNYPHLILSHGNIVLFDNSVNPLESRVLANLDQRTYWNLPDVKFPIFTNSGDFLIGVLEGKLMKISTTTGLRSEFCPALPGSVEALVETSPGAFVIAVFDQASRSLGIFRTSFANASSCVKLTGAAVTDFSSVSLLKISPDGARVLVRIDRVNHATNRDLLYVPLNGRPPMLVNLPTTGTSKVKEAFFSPDSKSILYLGDQILPGESNLFIWRVPE